MKFTLENEHEVTLAGKPLHR